MMSFAKNVAIVASIASASSGGASVDAAVFAKKIVGAELTSGAAGTCATGSPNNKAGCPCNTDSDCGVSPTQPCPIGKYCCQTNPYDPPTCANPAPAPAALKTLAHYSKHAKSHFLVSRVNFYQIIFCLFFDHISR